MTEKAYNKLERLFFFGRPLSPLYSLLMTGRSSLYNKGMLKQHKLEVPVISIGNLVLGGTGKTPLAHYVANFLKQHNRKPAILSRGYKGSAAAAINIVSDTTDILLDAAEAGDEPRLLAEKLPGIPVLTGKNRFTTGRFAIDSFGADALILDDGFQHLALKRDLDLVLFSARKCLGNGRVLPGGELREPVSALERADAFIISSSDATLDSRTEKFISFLGDSYPQKPLFTFTYKPETVLPRRHNDISDTIPQEDAAKMRLYGFCGIAGPESFKKTLEISGITLSGFQAYKDHHAYSPEDVEDILANARNSGADGLITTEKDLVKLRPLFPREIPILALPVQLHFNEDFDRFLNARLAKI